MVTIGSADILVAKAYLKEYLRWVIIFVEHHLPDELNPKQEFGVVSDNGALRMVVPLTDTTGDWVATGLGPVCRPEWWEKPCDVVN